jgi:hypothetical protein
LGEGGGNCQGEKKKRGEAHAVLSSERDYWEARGGAMKI